MEPDKKAHILLFIFFPLFLLLFLLMETVWVAFKIPVERRVDLALISSTFCEDYMPLSSSVSVESGTVFQIAGCTCIFPVISAECWMKQWAFFFYFMHTEVKAELKKKKQLILASNVEFFLLLKRDILHNICKTKKQTKKTFKNANQIGTCRRKFLLSFSLHPSIRSQADSLVESER